VTLAVNRYELGPIGTNCYVVRVNDSAAEAVVVDPGAEAPRMLDFLLCQGVKLTRANYWPDYYDELPVINRGIRGHGVDLAISTKETADYTARVDGDAFTMEDGKTKIFILPDPLNEHLDFHNTLNNFKVIPMLGGSHIFFVEDVGYQKAAIQEMERAMLAVSPIKPLSDKRSRLRVAATYIKNGTVVFPRKGCEHLLNQLLNFGAEQHDDLVDALVYLILGLVEYGLELPTIGWL